MYRQPVMPGYFAVRTIEFLYRCKHMGAVLPAR